MCPSHLSAAQAAAAPPLLLTQLEPRSPPQPVLTCMPCAWDRSNGARSAGGGPSSGGARRGGAARMQRGSAPGVRSRAGSRTQNRLRCKRFEVSVRRRAGDVSMSVLPLRESIYYTISVRSARAVPPACARRDTSTTEHGKAERDERPEGPLTTQAAHARSQQ